MCWTIRGTKERWDLEQTIDYYAKSLTWPSTDSPWWPDFAAEMVSISSQRLNGTWPYQLQPIGVDR